MARCCDAIIFGSVFSGSVPACRPAEAPQPLGGYNMGQSIRGRGRSLRPVFGHERLYVIDGATIPEEIGRNPTRTIAALAERSMEYVAAK